MANPTKGWDKVPVFGWYMELDGVTPKVGTVKLTLAQRVTSTDGRTIFPGGTITATLGGTDNDTAVLNQVRAAMSAVDQAAVEAGGGTFDAAAWGADWDARLPGAFFTSFPASDDPDIVEDGFQVKVEEKLASGDGKIYYITPLLADLGNPIPGVNLGTIAVPPGAPTAPAPIYQKGQPGGVASLDATGVVPLAQIPSGIGGASTWSQLTDKPAVIAAGATEQEALDAIGAAAAADVVPDTRTINGKPLSADVTLAASDVSAVPVARTVNGKALSADVALAAGDVGAVPTTRTVNGKPLSADVDLAASDVGATSSTLLVLSRPGDLSVTAGSSRLPLPAGTVLGVRASIGAVANAPVTVDVNRNGASIFANANDRPSIAVGAYQSAETAVSVAVADGDYLTVDVDATGGASAPTFVARVDAAKASNALGSMTRPAAAQTGDVHVAVLHVGVGGTAGVSQPATAVTPPTGWQVIAGPIRQVDNPANRDSELWLFWWRDDGLEASWTFTITQPASNSWADASVFTYRNCVPTGNPVDASATYATPASSSSWDAPAVTTTTDGDMVLSIWTVEQATSSIVYPTGETGRAPITSTAIYLSDAAASTAGAIGTRALTGSTGATSRDIAATVALLPDASATAPGSDLTVAVRYRVTA